ncbi:MAG: glycine--tRNA ligase subunit beta [Desulfurobacteriaceae bacterium]
MKTKNLLIEIGCEELPASFIRPALEFFKNELSKELKNNELVPSGIETFGTPRRLIWIVYDIPTTQNDKEVLIVGPSVKAAFDEDGNPTKAAIGFAKSKGVSVEDLIKVENPQGRKGIYVAVKKLIKGRNTVEILSEIVPKLITSIPFKKSMRWGTKKVRFGRPIRWITCVYGEDVVPFEVDGIKSGNVSYGHRFLSPEAFKVKSVNEFITQLEEHFVIADIEKRKSIILDVSETLAKSVDGELLRDDDLLEEVVNLVEYPHPILGSFDKEFLDLPKEVPIVVMKDHQKYFSVVEKDGKLKNHFIGVSNIKPVDENVVRQGYEKVLRARLKDALFFFNEDRKVRLEDRVPSLSGVVFHEKLGTMLDKTKRLEKLTPFISETLGFDCQDKSRRSSFLSKADLLTEMVNEFPELQGTMGKYYALLEGEEEEVAIALEEQYFPRFSKDKLPETKVGISLSLAEKIDNLIGFFGVGLKPTGSQDPFALRRNAIGLIQIILERKLHLNLKPILEKAKETYENQGVTLEEDVVLDVLSFIKERFRVILREKGYKVDTIDAVIDTSDDLLDVLNRARAVDNLREKEEFEEVLITMRRVVNIIPKGFEAKPFSPSGKYEVELFEKFISIKERLKSFVSSGSYKEALLLVKELKPYVDAFFDNVMVMDKDEEVRNRRLSLLKAIGDELKKLLDFSKIAS